MTKQPDSDARAGRDGPAEIEVTPAMERAGMEELYEVGLRDVTHLVRFICMAMEYERLDMRGKL